MNGDVGAAEGLSSHRRGEEGAGVRTFLLPPPNTWVSNKKMKCSADPVTTSLIALQMCFNHTLPLLFCRAACARQSFAERVPPPSHKRIPLKSNELIKRCDFSFEIPAGCSANCISPSVTNTSPANTGDLLEWRVSQQYQFFEAAWIKKRTSVKLLFMSLKSVWGKMVGMQQDGDAAWGFKHQRVGWRNNWSHAANTTRTYRSAACSPSWCYILVKN